MEWQPIETAPKDGTEILVARFHKGGATNGVETRWWADNPRDEEEGGSWQTGSHCDKSYWPLDPTHWMPLPAPPIVE